MIFGWFFIRSDSDRVSLKRIRECKMKRIRRTGFDTCKNRTNELNLCNLLYKYTITWPGPKVWRRFAEVWHGIPEPDRTGRGRVNVERRRGGYSLRRFQWSNGIVIHSVGPWDPDQDCKFSNWPVFNPHWWQVCFFLFSSVFFISNCQRLPSSTFGMKNITVVISR